MNTRREFIRSAMALLAAPLAAPLAAIAKPKVIDHGMFPADRSVWIDYTKEPWSTSWQSDDPTTVVSLAGGVEIESLRRSKGNTHQRVFLMPTETRREPWNCGLAVHSRSHKWDDLKNLAIGPLAFHRGDL